LDDNSASLHLLSAVRVPSMAANILKFDMRYLDLPAPGNCLLVGRQRHTALDWISATFVKQTFSEVIEIANG
jgi:hypothetical protein